jgi:uncharacterized protein (TIGR02391 family)
MINLGIHKEIHSKLMRRKNPTLLWGSPFENAWIGFVLNAHKDKDEITLNEILSSCERWIRSTIISEILKEEKNIGALSLYAGIISNFGDKKRAEEIQNLIKKRIIELDRKEKGKFSLFNSPEIFYSTTVGFVMSNVLKEEEREILLKYALNEVKNSWYNKVYRFALYSASLFELKAVSTVIDKIVNFLLFVSIKELSVDEVIPLLWFVVKYDEYILKSVKNAEIKKLVEDIKEKLWKQFENQYSYFSYELQTVREDTEIETGVVYSLSTFELGMIDDFLAHQGKVCEIDPNEIFDLLQLHPIIKEASEGLFKDKHYSQAIFEAYKALINYVKDKSGKKTLDGQELMGKIFDVKYNKDTLEVEKKPILQLNELHTREDMDEQKGFMHLFIGSVMGIRNPKAHGIIKQKDPFKTLEYLSLASLLAKRVDEAKFNSDF